MPQTLHSEKSFASESYVYVDLYLATEDKTPFPGVTLRMQDSAGRYSSGVSLRENAIDNLITVLQFAKLKLSEERNANTSSESN